MTLDQLGNLGELIAAIATLATLVYLAAQIRQSNRANRMMALARFAEASEGWLDGVVRDAELYSIYRRGMTGSESLGREERARFELMVVQFLRSIENGWHQRCNGLVDEGFWQGYWSTTQFIVGSPGGRRAFERNRGFFAPAFAREIDAMLASQRSEEVGEG